MGQKVLAFIWATKKAAD